MNKYIVSPLVIRVGYSVIAVSLLGGCATNMAGEASSSRTAAMGAVAKQSCSELAAQFSYPNLKITSVELVATGSVKRPGIVDTIPEHCVIKGALNERVSPVDGKKYAIGFEMRLPTQWNGRFFYQANGGLDGILHPAFGDILGGGPRSNGLTKGFAVISSDAGHALERNTPGIGGGVFGLDPQARLDYGYNAVAQLTPMAKSVVAAYYGKRPDKSYIVGTSNGGRHGMVAAARDSSEYDGVLATAPGYRLPYAGLAQLWDAQQFAKVAAKDAKTGRPDLNTSFSPADLNLVANKVRERCDALDGLKDDIVSDLVGCQKAFNVARDIPTCSATPGGQCLSFEQKKVLGDVFAGPKWRNGQSVYSTKAWDPGIAGKDWRSWKFVNAVGPRDPLAVAFVFSTPPVLPKEMDGKGTSIIDYVMKFDLDKDGQKIFAKDATYTQNAIEFILPPEAEKMSKFVARGGKLLVAHGASDPVFSALDTINWYEKFSAIHGAKAKDSARLFIVPGMNHSRNGPATDQYDMVDALVAWVEQGKAPDAIVAAARGKGTNLPNPEVPASWSPNRTRLLCAYPQVARYDGKGNPEVASSFSCITP